MGGVSWIRGAPVIRERLELFGRHGSLAGITSEPPAAPGEGARAPIVILSAGIIHKVGPSRVSVELSLIHI